MIVFANLWLTNEESCLGVKALKQGGNNSNNNTNGYLERLAQTGPKYL